MYPVVMSLFTGAIISECVKMSSKCCTRSCNCRIIRVARCFLNTAVAFRSRFNSTLIFSISNLDKIFKKIRYCIKSCMDC